VLHRLEPSKERMEPMTLPIAAIIVFPARPGSLTIVNVNGLLFHMTQPTSKSIIKAIACSKPTIGEH